MRNENKTRIPLWVESPRGDDRFGTNLNTGAIISDHEAKIQGVPFQQGIPTGQIQKAVETQLKADMWVCIEKKDGSMELLTKKDLPKLYPAPEPKAEWEGKIKNIKSAIATLYPVPEPKAEPLKHPNIHVVSVPKQEWKQPEKEQPKPIIQSDKKPDESVEPDEETEIEESEDQEEPIEETPKPKGEEWKDAFNVNPPKKPATTCASKPNSNGKQKEIWESKFENIKSATATHKGKGG